MADAFRITLIINIILLSTAASSTLIYLIPIIFIRRFHTANNILTINVCLTSILTCVFWIIYEIIFGFYPRFLVQSKYCCLFTSYCQIIVNCSLVYSLAIITINRFLTITYPTKRLFKRQIWYFISAGFQWILVIILSIPNLIVSIQECVYNTQTPYWINIYTFCIIILLPIICNVIFNSLIYFSVRSSTQRVHVVTTHMNRKLNYQNSRDIYLVKHMLFIFIIFILGWTPIYVFSIFNKDINLTSWVHQFLQMLPVISSVIIVLDLFFYNHDLRAFLKEKFCKCC